jgi:hypothetical protein
MQAIYPFVGGTTDSHKYNLMNPVNSDAAFRLTYFNGPTHDTLGMKGDGVDAYANTSYNPSVDGSQDNVSHFIYITSGSSSNSMAESGTFGGGGGMSIYSNFSDNFQLRTNDNNVTVRSNTTTEGFFGGSRTGSTQVYTKQNTTGTTVNVTSTTPNAADYVYLAVRFGSPLAFSDCTLGFGWLGTGLSNSQVDTLETLINTFQTALGRNTY